MKQLLALKAEYKQITGQDYKPGAAPAQAAPAQKAPTPVKGSPAPAPAGLYEQVAEQGEMVRKLKTEKAPKVRPQYRYCQSFLLSVLILLWSPAAVPAAVTERFSSCRLFIRIR